MADATKFCPHCLPQKVKWHLDSKSSYYLEKINRFFKIPQTIFFKKISNSVWFVLMDSFKILGLVTYELNVDESEIQNRHLIFFREAKKRNMQIYAVKFLGKYSADFIFYWKGKRFLYEGNPICNFINNSDEKIDDKYFVKKLFKLHNLPIAEGELFVSRQKALKYAETLGFPLVVKPRSGSLSKHVVTNINSLVKLGGAIMIAKQYRKDFIVEKYVEGRLYRVTVVGKKHVFVCEKEAPNVVGDGLLKIEELVKRKNLVENRHDSKNITLHKICIDNDFLQLQNYSINFIPKKDQKVYLNKKITLSLGCDIINYSDKVHPLNNKMFMDIAEMTNNDLIGIDFICKDISMPYSNQASAILELNSLPYIDMHENPSSGSKMPVSKIVWDFVLESISNKV